MQGKREHGNQLSTAAEKEEEEKMKMEEIEVSRSIRKGKAWQSRDSPRVFFYASQSMFFNTSGRGVQGHRSFSSSVRGWHFWTSETVSKNTRLRSCMMSRFQYLSAIGLGLVSLALPWLLTSAPFSWLGVDLDLLCSNFLFKSLGQKLCEPHSAVTEEDWDHFYHLGGNGPWIQKTNAQFGAWEEEGQPPDGCVVDQVHIVSGGRALRVSPD